MARPQRNDVDYFPFYCKQGGSTDYIEQTYGNDGIAVWLKILRELATTNYHYLNLSVEYKAMTFSSKCKVSEEMLFRIIADLVKLGELDAELWTENKIVWSDKFISSIEDAYKKRSNKILKREEFILMLVSLGIRKPISEGINSSVNPQRKEEKRREKKSKEDYAQVFGDGFNYEFLPETEKIVPREATELVEKICKYFSVTTDVMGKAYGSVAYFVETIFHRGELSTLINTFEKYKAYKARSQEQIHGIEKWIGTREEYFKDGKWCEINWELKLVNYEQQNLKGTFRTTSAQVNGTDYGTGFNPTRVDL